MARIKLDHRPILVTFQKDVSTNVSPCNFKFQAVWLLDSRFKDVVPASLEKTTDLELVSSRLQESLVKWHKESFESLVLRKKYLMHRILGRQKALENKPFRFLHNLNDHLTNELETILLQEERFGNKNLGINGFL